MLGLGHTIPKDRTRLGPDSGLVISSVMRDAGFTPLSQSCVNVLARQITDPANIYYQYDVMRAVMDAAGVAEIDKSCGLILAKQIF